MAEVSVKEERVHTYTLTLSDKEAAVVMTVLGKVTGGVGSETRNLVHDVYAALKNAGVSSVISGRFSSLMYTPESSKY